MAKQKRADTAAEKAADKFAVAAGGALGKSLGDTILTAFATGGWLYHETEEPRIFTKGEEIPAGWNSENRNFWSFDDYGKWVRNGNAE